MKESVGTVFPPPNDCVLFRVYGALHVSVLLMFALPACILRVANVAI